MLRIAVPNKGSLSDAAGDMLREAGYAVRRDPKELVVMDTVNDVELFYLRPRDIAIYVGSGTVDAGITGRDLNLDVSRGVRSRWHWPCHRPRTWSAGRSDLRCAPAR